MYKQAVIIGVWYDSSMKRKFRVNKKIAFCHCHAVKQHCHFLVVKMDYRSCFCCIDCVCSWVELALFTVGIWQFFLQQNSVKAIYIGFICGPRQSSVCICLCRFGWLGLIQDVPPRIIMNYIGIVLCLIRYYLCFSLSVSLVLFSCCLLLLLYIYYVMQYVMSSMLWRCWLGSWKGIWPVKNWVVGCWRGYLSGTRCRLAYGPADATATHCLLLQ